MYACVCVFVWQIQMTKRLLCFGFDVSMYVLIRFYNGFGRLRHSFEIVEDRRIWHSVGCATFVVSRRLHSRIIFAHFECIITHSISNAYLLLFFYIPLFWCECRWAVSLSRCRLSEIECDFIGISGSSFLNFRWSFVVYTFRWIDSK